jgi:putative nucleotidyltransferase with HDIG domain
MKIDEKTRRIFLDFGLFFINNFFLYLLLTSSFSNSEKFLIVIIDAAFFALVISGRRFSFIKRLELNNNLDVLGNINNPVLSLLSKKAPGTFNHSINVGQLSGNAGKAIGYKNDYLKIGAYYHDIGKIINSKIFVENKPNTDQKDVPVDLERKIIEHVKNGLKMAEKFRLPAVIRDVISQHHGTTQISSLKNLTLYYPGPKPQSKLTGIIMLSDCVEARSRSFKKLDEQLIEKIVITEMEKRISSGQLEDSTLTANELKKIQSCFIETLSHINHKRKYAK